MYVEWVTYIQHVWNMNIISTSYLCNTCTGTPSFPVRTLLCKPCILQYYFKHIFWLINIFWYLLWLCNDLSLTSIVRQMCLWKGIMLKYLQNVYFFVCIKHHTIFKKWQRKVLRTTYMSTYAELDMYVAVIGNAPVSN